VVERVIGNDEVDSSILSSSTIFLKNRKLARQPRIENAAQGRRDFTAQTCCISAVGEGG
jgi:hypothetical protein